MASQVGLASRVVSRALYNSSTVYGSSAANTTSSQALINELRFAAAKSIRTSTIILASFNAIAAFATACGILYDAYSSRKRNRLRNRPTTSTQSLVRSAEVYPLILSCGIAIQSIAFAAAQAQGLNGLITTGCTLIAQVLLPAVFLAAYIQLVFSVECALRGLRKKPFPARGKYSITVCLVVVGMLLLINFLVADFDRAPNVCFASLFWFIATYSRGSFATLLLLDIVLIICMAIISFRLTRSIEIDTSERVAASRMVYYLALAILSNTLIIPFFFAVGFIEESLANGQGLNLSMMAAVVANVSGLTTGGLHLFLRSSVSLTIGPRDKAGEYERRRIKEQIRRYDGGSGNGPNASDPDAAGHMMGPVGSAVDLRRMLSDASLISGSYDDKRVESGARRHAGSRGKFPTASHGFGPSSTVSSSRRPHPTPNPLQSNAFLPTAVIAAGASMPSAATVMSGAVSQPAVRPPDPVQMSPSKLDRDSVPTLLMPTTYDASAPPPSSSSSSSSSPSAMSSATTVRGSAMSDAKSLLLLLPATTYTPGPAKPAPMEALAPEPAAMPVAMHGHSDSLGGSSVKNHFDFSALKPPPSMNNLVSGRHRRDSSMVSSATVQIGLRLSNVDDFNLESRDSYMLGYADNDDDRSRESGMMAPPSLSAFDLKQRRPSEAVPLAMAADVVTAAEESRSPYPQQALRRPSPLSNMDMGPMTPMTSEQDGLLESPSRRNPVKDARMKTLPPVPRPFTSGNEARMADSRAVGGEDEERTSEVGDEDGDNMILVSNASGGSTNEASGAIIWNGQISPSVYSPQSPTRAKLPSPRGVGFASVPSRSNSTATTRTAEPSSTVTTEAAAVRPAPNTANPFQDPPRNLGASSRAEDRNEGDWI